MMAQTPSIWFQSTHPRGVRRAGDAVHPGAHAGFNPRTRVGCDLLPGCRHFRRCRRFNPRTRVGCDAPPAARWPRPWKRFNPRTRVGCDRIFVPGKPAAAGFNPRTRVGCDYKVHGQSAADVGFNPRTRVGCDERDNERDA